MAKNRLYLDNANANTSCESGGSVVSNDLISTDAAADTTVDSGNWTNGTFQRWMEWDINPGDLADGTANLSISINTIAKATVRMGVEVLDSGCTVDDSDTDTTQYTTAGVKTWTSKSLTVADSDRVRLFIEGIRTAGQKGNASVIIDTDHASSWIEYEQGVGPQNGNAEVARAQFRALDATSSTPPALQRVPLIPAETYPINDPHPLFSGLEVAFAGWQSGIGNALLWTARQGWQRSTDSPNPEQNILTPGLAWHNASPGSNAGFQYKNFVNPISGNSARTSLIVARVRSGNQGKGATFTGFGGDNATAQQRDWWIQTSQASTDYRAGITEANGHLIVDIGARASLAYFDDPLPLDEDVVLAVTLPDGGNTGDIRAWYNGVEKTQVDPQTGVIDTGTDQGVSVGCRSDIVSDSDIDIYCVLHWSRELSEGEIQALAIDPFILFRPEADDLIFLTTTGVQTGNAAVARLWLRALDGTSAVGAVSGTAAVARLWLRANDASTTIGAVSRTAESARARFRANDATGLLAQSGNAAVARARFRAQSATSSIGAVSGTAGLARARMRANDAAWTSVISSTVELARMRVRASGATSIIGTASGTAELARARFRANDAASTIGSVSRTGTLARARFRALDATSTIGAVSRNAALARFRLRARDATYTAVISRTAELARALFRALDASSIIGAVSRNAGLARARFRALDAVGSTAAQGPTETARMRLRANDATGQAGPTTGTAEAARLRLRATDATTIIGGVSDVGAVARFLARALDAQGVAGGLSGTATLARLRFRASAATSVIGAVSRTSGLARFWTRALSATGTAAALGSAAAARIWLRASDATSTVGAVSGTVAVARTLFRALGATGSTAAQGSAQVARFELRANTATGAAGAAQGVASSARHVLRALDGSGVVGAVSATGSVARLLLRANDATGTSAAIGTAEVARMLLRGLDASGGVLTGLPAIARFELRALDATTIVGVVTGTADVGRVRFRALDAIGARIAVRSVISIRRGTAGAVSTERKTTGTITVGRRRSTITTDDLID